MSAPDNTECECGRPKFGAAECCSRCAFLDGTGCSDARVIGALRLHSWLTLREMATIIGCRSDSLFLPVKRLYEAGRLQRQERECDSVQTTGRCRYGGRRRMSAGASQAWEYALAVPKRRVV